MKNLIQELFRENGSVIFRRRPDKKYNINMEFLSQIMGNTEALKLCIKQLIEVSFYFFEYSQSEFDSAIIMIKQCLEFKVPIKKLYCGRCKADRMKILSEILKDYCRATPLDDKIFIEELDLQP